MSATPPLPHVSTELAVAREHVEHGRLQEAQQSYRRVLAHNPTLPEALRFLANAALAHGRAAEAVDLLSRALESNRNDPDLLLELGAAYRAGERPDAARYVLERAVELSGSRRPVARLMLASVLEADQRADLALLHYFRAILDAQGMGQWLDDNSTEPGLRNLVKHAMAFVIRGRHECFDDALQPLRGGGTDGALARVDRAVAMYLRDSSEAPADPRQKPTFLYLPSLTTRPFLDNGSLPWLAECAHRIAGLGAEIDALASAAATPTVSPFNLNNLLGEGEVPTAKAELPQRLPVYQHGTLIGEARTHAPLLMAELDVAPLVHIPRHGPDAEVILLGAGDGLPLRYGRTNSRIAVAVALSGSGPIDLEVGGEPAILRPSDAIAFDPTFGYAFAGQAGGTARAVLFEVWHPALSALERKAIEAVTSAAVDFDSRLCELP